MKTVALYFDYASPWSYLACEIAWRRSQAAAFEVDNASERHEPKAGD